MILNSHSLRAAALLAITGASLGGATTPALADGDAAWTFPVNVGVVSDYIFRGQSQTWGKPALQVSAEADHASGAYVGVAASNVSDHWLPGATVELDLYGGYRGKIADTVGYDLNLIYYTYPGANWSDSVFTGFNAKNSLNTLEASVALSYEWLTLKTGATLTEYFGWSTNNSPTNGGFNGDASAGVTGSTRYSPFVELNAAYEVAEGWTVNGQLGHQMIRNSTGLDITYYKAGVSKAFADGWTVAASYSASSEPNAYKRFLSLANATSSSNIARDAFLVSVNKAF
jgi:uncharacterized protein (TIGR02001 family)